MMDVLCITKELYEHPSHCQVYSKCGPYGPQGPWAQPLFDCVDTVFFVQDFGRPKKQKGVYSRK